MQPIALQKINSYNIECAQINWFIIGVKYQSKLVLNLEGFKSGFLILLYNLLMQWFDQLCLHIYLFLWYGFSLNQNFIRTSFACALIL